MKKKRLLIGLLSVSMMFAAGTAIAGCEKDPPAENPPIVTPEPEHTAPVITVTPATVEINAGEEFEPLFGVSAKDDEGNDVNVIVSDDGDFDIDTEGTYTITYSATANGLTSTAKRTLKVNAALPALALEVRDNKLGETKWQGKLLNFKHHHFAELSADTQLTAQSGVFKNTSDSEIVLSVEGGYGVSAIIDKNGVVIEGRDGANGRLMNEANPSRASSSVTTLTVGGEEVTVVSAFAMDLHIPAGGFAIVVQTNYVGTTVDTDGRGFMNYNVIGEYGNVVRLQWADAEDGVFLTTYVNQGPAVTGNTKVYALEGDATFALETAVKAGLTVKDDNGTFASDDDVTIDVVTVVDDGDFDIDTVGEYEITLSVTDGEKATQFKRIIEVISVEEAAEIKIGDKTMNFLNSAIAVDMDLTAIGSYSFIVYTPAFEGTELGFANGYGEAFVLNKFGEIVRIYDGANGKYYDAENKAGIADATKCTAANYAKEAFASLDKEAGEILIIAANSTANNAAGGSRAFLLSNRTVGGKVTLTGVEFEEKVFTLTIGEGDGAKSFSATESLISINTAVTAATAPKFKMIVFTKDFDGEVVANGYGAAVVIDKFGKLVTVYDGANGGVYDETGKIATPNGFTSAAYATFAFENLKDGEMLIIFPNDGVNAADSARTFALGLRTDGSIGKTVTFTDVTFADPDAEPATEASIAIGDNTFKIDVEKVAVNPAAAGNADVAIFTTEFSGTAFAHGFGIALIIKDGKIVRVYDGISAKLYSADQPEGGEGCTSAGYLMEAISSLQGGEYALVGLNNGEHLFREFLRVTENRTLEKAVAISGITVTPSAKEFVTLSVNANKFFNPVVSVNAEVTAVGNFDFAVFTYGFNGIPLKNGWSEAFVIDGDGKIVRMYDGVNGKFYDEDNTAGIPRTDDLFMLDSVSLTAFLNLKPGETLIVGLNSGLLSNRGRAFLVSNRTFGATVAFDGVTVPEAETAEVEYMTITIGSKTWYQDVTKVANNAAYEGTPAFAIYEKDFDGTLISGGYGEAFIVDKETGKAVKIFDGANGKYYDAENTAGIADATKCTAAGYIAEAFAALEEGQYLLIAPNAGSTGNVARAFLLGNRTVGVAVSVEFPEEPQD